LQSDFRAAAPVSGPTTRNLRSAPKLAVELFHQRLNLDRTLEHLKDAAVRQICTTCGNVAKAGEVP
jgi:hypothetical protein